MNKLMAQAEELKQFWNLKIIIENAVIVLSTE